jgi:hypothetical protein
MVSSMKPPIFVRELSEEERERLEAGLRAADAFVMRRCQILLASARGTSPEDSPESWMRLADGAQRHPSLQREGPRSPHARLLSSEARACRLRRGGRRAVAGFAPPLPEGVQARIEPVDFGDGRRGGLRGGTHREAGLRGDRPGYTFAAVRSKVAAGEAVDSFPRPPIREKKDAATG